MPALPPTDRPGSVTFLQRMGIIPPTYQYIERRAMKTSHQLKLVKPHKFSGDDVIIKSEVRIAEKKDKR